MRRYSAGIRVFVASLAFIAVGAPETSHSAPYGATVLKPSGSFAVNTCAPYKVLLEVPISVSAASRVFAAATAQAPATMPPAQNVLTLDVVAVDSSGTVVGAGLDAKASQATPNYAVQSILHTGTAPQDENAGPLTLPPGDYNLQVRLLVRYDTPDCSYSYGPVTLTYMLLSSTFDRVFADGFA